MAITLFGTASTPSDNGTNTTNPTVVTPPGSMVAGQLVYLIACGANTSGTLAMSQAGGQTWHALTQRNATRNRSNCFWCVFNGTWSANPSVTMTGTANNIVRMLVFSPSDGSTFDEGSVHVSVAGATYSAPSSPYTVTIPSVTTTVDGTVVIATWTSADDNTWDAVSGELWDDISPAQVRNTSGSYDQSVSNAYSIMTPAGATGTASKNQATNGGDAGTRHSIAFREYRKLSGSASVVSGASSTGTIMYALSASGSAAAQSSATANGNKLKFVSGASAASSSATAGAINSGKVYAFYNWLVGEPDSGGIVVGGVAGPKVVEGVRVTEVSSYIVNGTSATFNVEERSSPESAGTDILASDQVADADGVSTSTIDNPDIADGSSLYLDISAVDGTPEQLSVTVTYYKRVSSIVSAAGQAVATSSAVAKIGNIMRAVKGAVASVSAAFARATGTLVLAGSVAAASSAVGGVSGTAILSASGSAAGASSAVASAGTGKIYVIYNWLVGSPAEGIIAGPKINQGLTVIEVSSYVTAATSVTFNVGERTTPESSGTDLLASDQVADVDGTTTGTISNYELDSGNWLSLEISAVSGTPDILSVTVTCLHSLTTSAEGSASSSSSAVANVTVLGAPRGHAASASSSVAIASVLRSVSGSAASSSSASATHATIADFIIKFYNWLIGTPTAGFVAGPDLVEGATISEVSGYIIGGTQVSFNLQERVYPQTPTAALITSDLSVGTTGASTATFDDATLSAGNTLFLDIRSVDGSPSILSVTVFYTLTIPAKGRSNGVSSASATAGMLHSASGSAASMFSTTGDFVRKRYVVASAASAGTGVAGARVTIMVGAGGSSSGSSSAVAEPTLVAPARGAVSSSSSAVAAASVSIVVRGSASGASSARIGGLGIVEARGRAHAISIAVGFADYKNRVFGHAVGISTAVARGRLSSDGNIQGTSSGVSYAVASSHGSLFGAKGHSTPSSWSRGSIYTSRKYLLFIKVAGVWINIGG